MNSGSFVVGVFCGAVVGVVVGWLLSGEHGVGITTIAERETDPPPMPDVMTATPNASNTAQVPTDDDEHEAGHPETSADTSENPMAPWPERLRTELKLEPKDDSWAYYMEQTLLEFLGAHASIQQFEISSIECRTTKCQIEVLGYDDSTVPVWQQIMYDILQQPWNEFGQYGSSSGTVNGRLTIVGSLHRNTGSE